VSWLTACGSFTSAAREGFCTAGSDPNCLFCFAGTLPSAGDQQRQPQGKILSLQIPANSTKPQGNRFPAEQKRYIPLGILLKKLDYSEIILAPQVGAKVMFSVVRDHPTENITSFVFNNLISIQVRRLLTKAVKICWPFCWPFIIVIG
jgi:hypothetical protein